MPKPAGEILDNRVMPDGKRYLRFVNSDPVDVAGFIKWLPWYARESGSLITKASEDAALGLHYFEALWWCRDMIRLPGQFSKKQKWVLLWWFGEVQRVRDTIGPACEAYLGYTGVLPGRMYLRSTKGVPDKYRAWDQYEVVIGSLPWIPERFLVMDGGVMDDVTLPDWMKEEK